MKSLTASLFFAASLAVFGSAGCKDDHGHSHDKPPATQGGGGDSAHPNQFSIGETAANGMKFKALQDEPLTPGGEGAFDLQVSGYPAGGKPKAVRFWVGVESGDGSVKARADEEKPDTWHTHVDVPKPIPAGSKLWVEVEPATGEKFKLSFDVKLK
jgi:hypothetical protein